MDNKNKIIIGIVALFLIAGGIWFLAFKNNGSTNSTAQISSNDTTNINISLGAKDSLEKNGFYAQEFYVIASSAFIRASKEKNAVILDSVKFGKKLYTKSVYYDEEGGGESGDESLLNNEKGNGYIAVYNVKPMTISQKPIGYILESTLVEEYSFENYKKYFSLPEFSKLESKIKRILIDESYFDGNSYALTQNAVRAPQVLTISDFDGDDIKDFAVVMDNMEKEYSCLTVFLTNKSTKEPYVAFRRAFRDFLKVKTMPKNSGTPSGTVLTNNAVVLYGSGYTDQIYTYNPETNKFDNLSRVE